MDAHGVHFHMIGKAHEPVPLGKTPAVVLDLLVVASCRPVNVVDVRWRLPPSVVPSLVVGPGQYSCHQNTQPEKQKMLALLFALAIWISEQWIYSRQFNLLWLMNNNPYHGSNKDCTKYKYWHFPRCDYIFIDNIPVMVQIMACRQPVDKPLYEPMIVRLPTHICVTCLNELMHLCMIWITITAQCRSCKWINNKCIGHIKWSLYLYDSDPRIYLVKEIFEKTPFSSNPYLGWCRYHKSNRPTISSVALSPGAIRPKQMSWAMLFVPTRSMTNLKKRERQSCRNYRLCMSHTYLNMSGDKIR